jgi:hypothetical protein
VPVLAPIHVSLEKNVSWIPFWLVNPDLTSIQQKFNFELRASPATFGLIDFNFTRKTEKFSETPVIQQLLIAWPLRDGIKY